jgi:hypothetical protein
MSLTLTGAIDAGAFDAGAFDAGAFDAGAIDAGAFDALDVASLGAGVSDLSRAAAARQPANNSSSTPRVAAGFSKFMRALLILNLPSHMHFLA